jgi:hypothetical protein
LILAEEILFCNLDTWSKSMNPERFSGLHILVILFTVALSAACIPPVDGLPSIYGVTVTVVSGAVPLPGATVTLDGVDATTDNSGRAIFFISKHELLSGTVSKSLFNGSTFQLDTTSEEDTAITIDVDLDPRLIFADSGNNRIVMMNDMSGDGRVNVGSFPTAGPEYGIKGPNWVEVDYINGVVYVADSDNSTYDGSIIKFTAFPPLTAADQTVLQIDTDTQFGTSFGTNARYVNRLSCIVLDETGDVYVSELGNSWGGVKARVFKFESDFTPVSYFDEIDVPGGISYGYNNGIDILADGSVLVADGAEFVSTYLYTVSGMNAATASTFTSLTKGPGIDETQIALSVNVDSQYAYMSDTLNGRIVRYDLVSKNRTNYTPDSGAGHSFSAPQIMAILPNRKILIEDEVDDKLVLIDSFEDGNSSWREYNGGSDPFNFAFYYESS